MFLLDTNVISELRVGKPNVSAEVIRWAASVPASRLYLSSITTLEIEMGVLQLELRTPPQGAAIRAWFQGVRKAFAGRILGFSEEASILCASMHLPNPRSSRDAMIAAIAREHGFTVVTRNESDFVGTGVSVINPWVHGST